MQIYLSEPYQPDLLHGSGGPTAHVFELQLPIDCKLVAFE